MSRMGRVVTGTLLALGASLGVMQVAEAVPTPVLAMKLSDSAAGAARLDAQNGWVNAGGFNEGNPAAQLLVNNNLDYKASFVDAWAGILGVRVSMYLNGVEQKFVQFNAVGTTKVNFFTQANVQSSSWNDVAGPGNFFSIAGDAGIDRHWFINNNYGGCGVDVGHMVVVDGRAGSCGWETGRTPAFGPNRGFLYSTGNTELNWNPANNVGIADVFAVFVIVDREPPPVPEPATLALLGLGLAGLGMARRRKS